MKSAVTEEMTEEQGLNEESIDLVVAQVAQEAEHREVLQHVQKCRAVLKFFRMILSSPQTGASSQSPEIGLPDWEGSDSRYSEEEKENVRGTRVKEPNRHYTGLSGGDATCVTRLRVW